MKCCVHLHGEIEACSALDFRALGICQPHDKPKLLTLFTTFRPDESRNVIHKNVIKNWAALGCDVSNLLYSSEIDGLWQELAVDNGWELVSVPRENPHGLPFVRDMFEDARDRSRAEFYGYSNGDILFSDGLLKTLRALDSIRLSNDRMLIIGIRKNFHSHNRTVFTIEEVKRIAATEGEDYLDVAIDFFIFHKNAAFPYHLVPDLVVGRSRYDNFLVSLAVSDGMTVVDASETLIALHQTGLDGNLSGHQGDGRKWNIDLLGPGFNYFRGSLKAATHRTIFNKNGEIEVTLKEKSS